MAASVFSLDFWIRFVDGFLLNLMFQSGGMRFFLRCIETVLSEK